MSLGALVSRRMARRLLPLVVVLVVASIVAISLVSSVNNTSETFAFNIYWPSPSSSTPGTAPPTAYLQINYTGSGEGNYTYIIAYNSSSGAVVYHNSALVSSAAPFRDYVFINVPSNETVVVSVQVFRDQGPQAQLLFTKSITL